MTKKGETKVYINRKIDRCTQLKANASSPEQAEAYEVYRQFWIKKLPKNQNPDIVAEKKIAVLKREAAKKILAEEKLEKKRIEAEEREIEAQAEVDREAKQAAVLKQIEDLKKLLPEYAIPKHMLDVHPEELPEEEAVEILIDDIEEEVPEDNGQSGNE